MIPDIGSDFTDDVGYMSNHGTVNLSASYRYNVYHYQLSTLGPSLRRFLSISRDMKPFQERPLIRTQPDTYNLLTPADLISTEDEMVPPKTLNWTF